MGDEPRQPLRPPEAEARRRALAEQGLGEDLLRLNLTDAEKQAANTPFTVDPRWKELPAMEPLISPTLAKVAAAIAVMLGLAASFVATLGLPPWVGVGLWALTYVASLLAGVALPEFKGTTAVVPATLVPTLLSISAGLVAWGSTLPPGWLQSGVLFLGALLGAVAGKAMPTPTVKV